MPCAPRCFLNTVVCLNAHVFCSNATKTEAFGKNGVDLDAKIQGENVAINVCYGTPPAFAVGKWVLTAEKAV